jgi:hypothetical protein
VVLTDVSEERIASIFRVEGKMRKSAHEASVRDVKADSLLSRKTEVNGGVHGGRPRPTGTVVPRGKKCNSRCF